MTAISQATFPKRIFLNENASIEISLKFVPKGPINDFQHWIIWWLSSGQATSHYLNQKLLDYRHIYASLRLNELNYSYVSVALGNPEDILVKLYCVMDNPFLTLCNFVMPVLCPCKASIKAVTSHISSWMKMLRLKFHWSLFLRVQLTISSTGSYDGLAPARPQAITWTKNC